MVVKGKQLKWIWNSVFGFRRFELVEMMVMNVERKPVRTANPGGVSHIAVRNLIKAEAVPA